LKQDDGNYPFALVSHNKFYFTSHHITITLVNQLVLSLSHDEGINFIEPSHQKHHSSGNVIDKVSVDDEDYYSVNLIFGGWK